MVKRMKVVDGQLTYVGSSDRGMIVDMVNMLFDDRDAKDAKIRELKWKLEEPTDEKLAEAYKEIERLKAELNYVKLKSLYVMSEEQKEESYKWWDKHRKECNGQGRYMEWVVIGTGIGDCLKYRCKHCGEEIDLTDDSNW